VGTEAKALTDALASTRAFEGVTGYISHTRPSGTPLKTITILGLKEGKYEVTATINPH
jgi:hypothetical protein